MRRDSGPAVAVAAALAAERDPRAVVVVLASDHFIQNPQGFHDACRQAAIAAADGTDRDLRCAPTHAATNYGYIRAGHKLNGGAALAVDAFVEKPNADKAAIYLTRTTISGTAATLSSVPTSSSRARQFEPEIAAAAKQAVAARTHDLDFIRLDAESFARHRRNPSTMH